MAKAPPPVEPDATAAVARKSLFANPAFRKRVFVTLALIATYRVGSLVPVPGVDAHQLALLASQATGTLAGAYDEAMGGNLFRLSIVALGIMPYLSASVAVQLLALFWPRLVRLSETGEPGRNTIIRYTRYLTVLIGLIQSLGIALFLHNLTEMGGAPVVVEPGSGFILTTTLTLTTGAVGVMWLAEQITERGVGNGMALVIFAGIVSGITAAAAATASGLPGSGPDALPLSASLLVMAAAVAVIARLWQGRRWLSVEYPARTVGEYSYEGVVSRLPLKVCTGGIIPVVLALEIVPWVFSAVGEPLGLWGYAGLLAVAVIGLTFLYTAIVFDSDDVADNLQKYGGVIPGIRPGTQTARHIDSSLTRVTLLWSLCIAAVAVLPILGGGLGLVSSLGGAPLLILVAVSIETLQQIKAQTSRDPSSGGVAFDEFVPITIPRGAAAAAFIASLLGSAGIRFWVKNEGVQDLFGIGRIGTGFSVFTRSPVVCVEPARAREAAALLAALHDDNESAR